MLPEWTLASEAFERDGTLRDIYVAGTTITDWSRLLQWLRTAYPGITYTKDGVHAPLPSSAPEAFGLRAVANSTLHIPVAGIDMACHFFTEHEIELDFPPEQVDNQARFSALLAFVAALGTLLGKTVVVSPENGLASPFLQWTPLSNTVTYLAPGSAAG